MITQRGGFTHKKITVIFSLLFCITVLTGCVLPKNETGTTEPTEYVTDVIHMEKRDLTHDGIADYIVTTMTYSPKETNADISLEDRILQHITHDVVCVKIYKGLENSDTYNEEELLWSNEYAWPHAGNGQLSIVQVNGMDYLLSSSFWMGQNAADFYFEVFSLDSAGNIEMLDRQSISFKEVNDNEKIRYETVDGDTPDDYIHFQNMINKYIDNGILIAACDIDSDKQFIRTENNLYTPQDYYPFAFSKINIAELSSELKVQEENYWTLKVNDYEIILQNGTESDTLDLIYRKDEHISLLNTYQKNYDYQTPSDISAEYFEECLGHSGFRLYIRKLLGEESHYYEVFYYTAKNGELEELAYRWGAKDEDVYEIDTDGDGIKELICNVIWMADGAVDVIIYHYDGNQVIKSYGSYLLDEKADISGVASVMAEYLPEKEKVLITYWRDDLQKFLKKEYDIKSIENP